MTPLLRSRLALFALFAAFAIPVGMSSLRGLTHLLTCREPAATPFTLSVPPPELGPPQITSSSRFSRGEETGLCGGLFVDLGVHVDSPKIQLKVGISNISDVMWKGSVELHLGDASVPVGIGEVAPAATESRLIDIELEPGSHDLNGELLIGP